VCGARSKLFWFQMFSIVQRSFSLSCSGVIIVPALLCLVAHELVDLAHRNRHGPSEHHAANGCEPGVRCVVERAVAASLPHDPVRANLPDARVLLERGRNVAARREIPCDHDGVFDRTTPALAEGGCRRMRRIAEQGDAPTRPGLDRLEVADVLTDELLILRRLDHGGHPPPPTAAHLPPLLPSSPPPP